MASPRALAAALALALASTAAIASGAVPDPTDPRSFWSHGTCTGKGRVTLGAPPLRLDDI